MSNSSLCQTKPFVANSVWSFTCKTYSCSSFWFWKWAISPRFNSRGFSNSNSLCSCLSLLECAVQFRSRGFFCSMSLLLLIHLLLSVPCRSLLEALLILSDWNLFFQASPFFSSWIKEGANDSAQTSPSFTPFQPIGPSKESRKVRKKDIKQGNQVILLLLSCY